MKMGATTYHPGQLFHISHYPPLVSAQDLEEFIILEHYKYMFRAQLLSDFTKISNSK